MPKESHTVAAESRHSTAFTVSVGREIEFDCEYVYKPLYADERRRKSRHKGKAMRKAYVITVECNNAIS